MTHIDLTDRIWLKRTNDGIYSLIFEDDSDFMMTMTGYDDDNFSKISWIRPNGCKPLIVGESEINGKKISKIIQDTEGNYVIYI